jgi:hypothetical protein
VGKKAALHTHHAPHFYVIFALVAAILGVAVFVFYTRVFAQSSDVGVIHGCVKNENGLLRVLKPNESCQKSETSLDWNIKGPPGSAGVSAKPYLAFYCLGCYLVPVAESFKGQDISGANITNSTFEGTDLSGTIFRGASLSGVNFRNVNLTGADFSNSNVAEWVSISSDFANANLTNANFTNSNLRGSNGMGTANVSGTIWSNTVCPDGTNSNNNGNTCEGHF